MSESLQIPFGRALFERASIWLLCGQDNPDAPLAEPGLRLAHYRSQMFRSLAIEIDPLERHPLMQGPQLLPGFDTDWGRFRQAEWVMPCRTIEISLR